MFYFKQGLSVLTSIGIFFFAMFLIVVVYTIFTLVAELVTRKTCYFLIIPTVSLYVVVFPAVVARSFSWWPIGGGRGQGRELLPIPRVPTIHTVVMAGVVVCGRGAREAPHL